jgi:putative ABC transport system permease protein
MRFLPQGWRAIRRIWRRAPARDVDAEVTFHLGERTAELIARGISADAARAQAEAEFGDVAAVRSGLVAIDTRLAERRSLRERWEWLGQDVRYVWRSLRRSPGFVVAVALTLALGLGANAAIFSLLDRLFVQAPGGVSRPDTVHRLYRTQPPSADDNLPARPAASAPAGEIVPQFNYPEFRVLKRTLPPAAQLAGYATGTATLGRGRDAVRQVSESFVAGDYFVLLGVRPLLGHFFTPDALRAETPVAEVVISVRLWQSFFHGRADVVGQSLDIDHHRHIVIAVVPNDFHGPDLDAVDIWVPMNTMGGFHATDATPWYNEVNAYWIVPLVRAATPTETAAVIQRATAAFHGGALARDSTSTATLASLVEAVRPGMGSDHSSIAIATRLAGVSLIILLITCANVGNLLLARAMRRRREIAVRLALGVSRRRLVTTLVSEGMAVALLGAAVALLIAWWGAVALRTLLLPKIHWADAPIDARLAMSTLIVALVAAVAAGLPPALLATRTDIAATLKAGAHDGLVRRSRLRTALLVTQSALAVMLLAGAGLFLRSLHSVETEQIGFDVDRLVFASVNWDPEDGDHGDDVTARFASVRERVGRLPGVEMVATSSTVPMQGFGVAELFLPDRDKVPQLPGSIIFVSWVSPEFFAVTGIEVLRGRGMLASDRVGSPLVVFINATMARTIWPGENPLDKCLIIGVRTAPCRRVAGIVSDAHFSSIIEAPSMQYFVPAAQDTSRPPRHLVIRAAPGRVQAVTESVRAALQDGYGAWAVPRVRSMVESLAPQLRPWRIGATLFSFAGGLALLVAIVGMYGVISFVFAQRTHEIGVRMALGARAGNVIALVVGAGVRMVAAGVAIGLLLTLMAGRLVESMLYKTSPREPAVLVVVSIVLLLVAVAACLIPAWRALRVDPVVALRAD